MSLLSKFEHFFSKTHLNLLKTIYVNFRVLPIKQALHFPIYIYGKCSVCDLSGNVKFNCSICPGLVKFGYRQGFFAVEKGGGQFFLSRNSRLIFNGPCCFDYDYSLRITEGGTVSFGSDVGFGSETKIYCEKSITIGNNCRIPFGTTFMDTNYHYSINTKTGIVGDKSGSIVIGDYCWIGNTSTIMKGSVIPDGCIVASRSMVNKNFVKLSDGKKCLVLAGSPASIVSEDCTRVHSLEIESEIKQWFLNHPDMKMYENKDLLKKIKKYQDYIG